MKERIKNTVNSIKQRTRFYQGVVAGLFIMSALSYAAVTLTTFTANTTISATDMNANFTAIKDKLNDGGFIAKLTSNFSVTACDSGNMNPSAPYMEVIVPNSFEANDGNFTPTSGEYTIATAGIYQIYVEGPNTLNTSNGVNLNLEIYNGSWTSESVGIYAGSSVVRRFTVGQKIRLKVGCGYKFPNYSTTPLAVDKNKFTFALKKF